MREDDGRFYKDKYLLSGPRSMASAKSSRNFSVQQAEPPALVCLGKLRSWVCRTSPGAFRGLRCALSEKKSPRFAKKHYTRRGTYPEGFQHGVQQGMIWRFCWEHRESHGLSKAMTLESKAGCRAWWRRELPGAGLNPPQ